MLRIPAKTSHLAMSTGQTTNPTNVTTTLVPLSTLHSQTQSIGRTTPQMQQEKLHAHAQDEQFSPHQGE